MLEKIIKYFATVWGLFNEMFLVCDGSSIWLQLANPHGKALIKSIDLQYKFLLSARALEFKWKLTDTPGGCFSFWIGIPLLFNFKFTITSYYWHWAYKFTKAFDDISYGFSIGADGVEFIWARSEGLYIHRTQGYQFKITPYDFKVFFLGEITSTRHREEVLDPVCRYILWGGEPFVIRIKTTKAHWNHQSNRLLAPVIRDVSFSCVVEVIAPADISLPHSLCYHVFNTKDSNCYESVVDSIVNDIHGYLAK